MLRRQILLDYKLEREMLFSGDKQVIFSVSMINSDFG